MNVSPLLPAAVLSILSVHLALPLSASARSMAAQACGNCPQPVITAYDFNVTVPRPADSAIGPWYGLFLAGPAALEAAQASADAGCARFLDGLIAHSGRADTLSFGLATAHTAPDGPVQGTDYLLTGKVSGQPGSYTVEVDLETACSREKAAHGSKTFSQAGDAMEAGRSLAATALAPIAGTLENFEKQKRDGDVLVARFVRDDGIVVKPSKRRAVRNENVAVDIALTDCDGTPLAGRTVKLVESQFKGMLLNGSSLGAFTAATAVTDAGGVAHAVFKTGTQKGTAILRVYFVYEKPTGCDMVVGGTGMVVIEDSPPTGYAISARYQERSTIDRKTKVETEGGGIYLLDIGRFQSETRSDMSLRAYAENESTEPGVVDLIAETVAPSGSLIYTGEDFHHSLLAAGGQTSEKFTITHSGDRGMVIPQESSTRFHYDPADPASNHFDVTFSVLNRQVTHSFWINDEDGKNGSSTTEAVDTALGAVNGNMPWEGGIGTFAKTDSGYVLTLKHDSSWTEADTVTRHTRSVELTAVIRPWYEEVNGILPDGRVQRGPGRPGFQARIYDVLGRWSGQRYRHPAGVYVGAPLR